jgi:hypothetical protein
VVASSQGRAVTYRIPVDEVRRAELSFTQPSSTFVHSEAGESFEFTNQERNEVATKDISTRKEWSWLLLLLDSLSDQLEQKNLVAFAPISSISSFHSLSLTI